MIVRTACLGHSFILLDQTRHPRRRCHRRRRFMASLETPVINPSSYKLLLSCPSGLSRSQVTMKDGFHVLFFIFVGFVFHRFWFEVWRVGIGGIRRSLWQDSSSGCWFGGIHRRGEGEVLFFCLNQFWLVSFEMKLLNYGDFIKLGNGGNVWWFFLCFIEANVRVIGWNW